jgi:hypothetical protein
MFFQIERENSYIVLLIDNIYEKRHLRRHLHAYSTSKLRHCFPFLLAYSLLFYIYAVKIIYVFFSSQRELYST